MFFVPVFHNNGAVFLKITLFFFLLSINFADAQNNRKEMIPPILVDHWLNCEVVPKVPADDYLLFIYVNYSLTTRNL